MSIRLLMTGNSVRNNTISCDSLGIHYDVSRNTETNVITVQRWDSESNAFFFVGEFHLFAFKHDQIRMGSNGEWMLKRDYLYKEGSNPISSARTFETKDGTKYRWKIRWDKLQLCHHSSANLGDEPLVIYHRHITGGKPSYLEVRDPSVMKALDSIIVTFLIMEKEHRDD
ncbi:hypothetical protein FRC17_005058 [Serendipita sp. 399]|nr:hypothetical protein FRC17_005058 [Serendipita sp. 399]